jgi:CHAD domain-containing protein
VPIAPRLKAALTRHAAPKPRSRKSAAAMAALDSFARLALEMQHLHAGNLHDFRKRAKKARYIAEVAAEGDRKAQQVARALKELQDDIGEWHDWLVLADEAHAASVHDLQPLKALIEKERDDHFVSAMKTVAKLRGRLMGEWQALRSDAPCKRPRGADPHEAPRCGTA